MTLKHPIIFSLLALAFCACGNGKKKADAYGNFESNETIVSAESNGRIMGFDIEEGQKLAAGVQVGIVDTVPVYLKRLQLLSSMRSLNSHIPDISGQMGVISTNIDNLSRERRRVAALVRDGAATPKQLDDIDAQLRSLNSQMVALRSQYDSQTKGVLSEQDPMQVQLRQLDDALAKCHILNPIAGIVTAKFNESGEIVGFGKALYKIANMDTLILRAFVAGDQLVNLKTGQDVKVMVDAPGDKMETFRGRVSWISDKAEFTPKVIQTKDERVNLVYAFKVLVPNDGRLKMGMPAEVYFK